MRKTNTGAKAELLTYQDEGVYWAMTREAKSIRGVSTTTELFNMAAITHMRLLNVQYMANLNWWVNIYKNTGFGKVSI